MTEPTGLPLTGTQYTIAAGPYRATVTEAGAGLRELSRGDVPLVLAYDADEPVPAAVGQLLIPWPNRVDHGRYDFDGTSHVLDITEPARDTAIHGLVRWAQWTAAVHEPHRIVLTHRLLGHPGYPFRLDLEAEYTLDPATGLTVRITAHNSGGRTAPYGHGAHPYLQVGQPIDECLVTIPADRYLPTDNRGIPSAPQDVTGTPYDLREPRRLGATRIDNAYTGLRRDASGRAWVRLATLDGARSAALWVDETHPLIQIYTGDEVPGDRRRTGLGVEPMTCPPNAFVTGTEVTVLKSGDTVTGTYGIMSG